MRLRIFLLESLVTEIISCNVDYKLFCYKCAVQARRAAAAPDDSSGNFSLLPGEPVNVRIAALAPSAAPDPGRRSANARAALAGEKNKTAKPKFE